MKDFLELDDDDIFERIILFSAPYNHAISPSHPVYSSFGGYDILINRVKNIGKNKSENLDSVEETIENNKLKIKEIDNYEISRFFSKMNMNDFTKDLNVFEIFLLRRGYISEDYRNYINVFHEGDITETDFNYILTVKKNSMLSYEYEINNLKNTILRLDISDFLDTNFLNNDIVEEIIANNEYYPKQFKELTSILNRHSDTVIDFTSQFINKIKNKQEVMPILFENMNEGLMQIIKERRNETELMHSIIDSFLTYVKIDPNEKLSVMVTEYIEESANVDYLFEKYSGERMDKLKELNIRLKVADIENKPYLPQIYDNFIISFYKKYLYGYLKYKEIDVEEICKKHLTAISTSNDLEQLYEYVISNMGYFIDEFYRYTNDTEEDEEVILKVLREIHDIDLKNDLINVINIQFSNIENALIDRQLRDSILIAGKFKGTWDNLDSIFKIYSENENIPDEYVDFESLVASFFELNYVELCKTKWHYTNSNLKNMGYILRSKKISTSTLEQTLGSIPIVLNVSSSSFDEMDFDRIEMLIQNNKIKLTVDVIDRLISNEEYVLASKVVMNNFGNFIEEIDKYIIDEELVGACLLNEEAKEEDKLLLLNNIDISLVNNKSKEFFVEKANPKEIHKYNEGLIGLYFELQEEEEYILVAIHDLLVNNVPIYNFTPFSKVGEISKIGDNEIKYAKINKSEIGFEVAELLRKKKLIRNYSEFKNYIRLSNSIPD